MPEDTRAEQLVDPHIGKDGFLDVFGRPPRESSCECERRTDFSLPQALNLVNGRTISDAVADPNGRVAKLVLSGKSDEAVVDELYLASLSRPPTPDERERGVTYLERRRTAQRAPRICCGRCSTAKRFCTSIEEDIMLNHSRTSRLHLRRTHAPRIAAHRLHRDDGPEPSALLLLARPGQRRQRRQQIRRRARLRNRPRA